MTVRARVLIADDEPLARDRLRSLLAEIPGIEVCGECCDGKEAVEAIERLAPDIVFLDIRMPELDGLEVIDALGVERMPVVVFVTAHDDFALEAFERHAVDYLLKPPRRDRFRRTVERALSWVESRRGSSGQLRELLAELRRRRRYAGRIVVRAGGRLLFVRVGEIRWIAGARNYVELHTARGTHLVRKTMGEIEAELDPERFLRIHRSTIVQIDCVREVQPAFKGDYVVVLDDGTELAMSRRAREKLEERLEKPP